MNGVTKNKKSKSNIRLRFMPFILLVISGVLLSVGVFYTVYTLGYEEADEQGALESLHSRSITISVIIGVVFLVFWSVFYILVKRKKREV